ncbi:hypothetical protein [Pedobacter sp. Leaf176]|uniref:hypothetical protein n=1 Tax=Pedobacter sp. Leaf176 TaxID=1736286 RepID=UPI0006F30C57|nr:hypothetical protein [Pedobacter sp. Leaf176]KQR72650.1 hypothetical protein ASF92_05090 [Pedobacter sp. Leaf176]
MENISLQAEYDKYYELAKKWRQLESEHNKITVPDHSASQYIVTSSADVVINAELLKTDLANKVEAIKTQVDSQSALLNTYLQIVGTKVVAYNEETQRDVMLWSENDKFNFEFK